MKDLTTTTKLYLLFVYALGSMFLVWNIFNWQPVNPLMLAALCTLASLSLIIKVEGATSRSHYTFSFIFYGFAFIHLGVAGAVIVIIVSNIVEWLVNRPAWYISAFQHSLLYFRHQYRWFCLPMACSRSITQYPFTHPGNYRQHVGFTTAQPHYGRDHTLDGPG